jgi:hypothetical protein
VAATEHLLKTARALLGLAGRLAKPLAGLAGLLAAGQHAQALTLPEDKAEAMFHVYDGGGVKATGPALLVRKSLADKFSLSGKLYVDAVSNASIDVVTTASPYKETRTAADIGLDYLVRDSLITLGLATSSEPDYKSRTLNLDIAQEVFGGMSTVSLGFSRGADKVGRKGEGFFDAAHHWNYRLGLSQVLTPRWMATANLEVLSDDGYLGSPYRVAQVQGAYVNERVPRTRTARAMKFRAIGDMDSVLKRSALRAEYRYYWDTWAIKAHTFEVGGSRYFGDRMLGDVFLRLYKQGKALFYADNATLDTTYVTRNRQLGDFTETGLGGRVSYALPKWRGQFDIKLNGSYEFKHFNFSSFTDLRTGRPYSNNASVLQLYMSATY